MQYQIKSKKSLLKYKFLELEEAQIVVDRYDGGQMELYRLGMLRGEVICLLLKNVTTEKFVFVEQFRYSVVGVQHPWITEVVAGIVDSNEEKEKAVIRECLEETGYVLEKPQWIKAFMPSVGLSNQVIDFYYGEVESKDKANVGGGLSEETEDIRVVEMDISEAIEKERKGKFMDVKTITAINWYALNKM